ncbi:hypothetical protein D3C75_872230 [compost metagenome]
MAGSSGNQPRQLHRIEKKRLRLSLAQGAEALLHCVQQDGIVAVVSEVFIQQQNREVPGGGSQRQVLSGYAAGEAPDGGGGRGGPAFGGVFSRFRQQEGAGRIEVRVLQKNQAEGVGGHLLVPVLHCRAVPEGNRCFQRVVLPGAKCKLKHMEHPFFLKRYVSRLHRPGDDGGGGRDYTKTRHLRLLMFVSRHSAGLLETVTELRSA